MGRGGAAGPGVAGTGTGGGEGWLPQEGSGWPSLGVLADTSVPPRDHNLPLRK